MSSNPIRVATAALSQRIFAGRPTKDGKGFKEPRYDVTSDVLVAIRDKVGIGNEVTVECDGKPQFRIVVLPVEAPPSALLTCADSVLIAFAEGVVWSDEQRQAYVALHDAVKAAKAREGRNQLEER